MANKNERYTIGEEIEFQLSDGDFAIGRVQAWTAEGVYVTYPSRHEKGSYSTTWIHHFREE